MDAPKTMLYGILAEPVPLLADPDRVVAQLGTEDLLQKQTGLERLHVDMVEQPVESPPHTLAGHAKRAMDLAPIGSFQDHVAGLSWLQLDPKVPRLHQGLQVLQEHLVLLGQFHVLSP